MIAKDQLNILIQLAETDKHFAGVEREMILSIAKNKDFSEQEVRDLIKNPLPIGSMAELTFDEKFEYLMTAIELVFADKNVFEKEIIFCKDIAVKLGFKKSIIDYFIDQYGQKAKSDFKEIAFESYFEHQN